MSSIFTKIINNEISAYKIYEDEYVLAFLDVNPMQKGHTLVVPKKEVEYLFDLDEELYSNVMERVQMVAKVLKEKLGCQKVCMLVEGYAVPHAHVHLIPTNNADDFDKKYVHKASEEELEEVFNLLKGDTDAYDMDDVCGYSLTRK